MIELSKSGYMLPDIEFQTYCRKHDLLQGGIDYLRVTRNSPPSRKVGRNAQKNLVGNYPSKKMGHTISFESHGPERSFILLSEYDDNVIEIWDQPDPVYVERANKHGKRRATYTPDFLLLTKAGPCVVEVKSLEQIEKLLEDQPYNWIREEDGTVRFLPGEKFFESIGLKFAVYISKLEDAYKLANIEMLINASAFSEKVDDLLFDRLHMAFAQSFAWRMAELKKELSLVSYDPILSCIRQRRLHFNFQKCLLSEPESTYLVLYPEHVPLLDELMEDKPFDGEKRRPKNLQKFPTMKETKKVIFRLEQIASEEKSRSIRRWNALVADGAKIGLVPFESLVGKHHLKGNRNSKLPVLVSNFVQDFIENDFLSEQGLSIYWGHKRYQVKAKEVHPDYPPVSKKTFSRRIHSLPLHVLDEARFGSRARNAAEQSSDPYERNLSAQLAWQRVAIDHYKADVFVVLTTHQNETVVVRPWISAMIDLATKKVISVIVCLKDPSKITCAKLIRECVRKHCRLPKEIVADRGSDFRSNFFAALLARFNITLSFRPTSQGKFGGEVEGLFGEFKQIWLSQRPGNITEYKNAREVDGNYVPAKSAILLPSDLYRELQKFCEWRDAIANLGQVESRLNKFERDSEGFVSMSNHIDYDEDFEFATSIDTRDFTINPRRGIYMNGQWFLSSAIPAKKIAKGKTEVRIDPENPHQIWALIHDKWQPLTSGKIRSFSAKDKYRQLAEGMVLLEAKTYRNALKEQHDLVLVQLVHDAYAMQNVGGAPIIKLPVSAEALEEKMDDIDFTFDDLPEIKAEAW